MQYIKDICPEDGQYSIAQYTTCYLSDTIKDHTGNKNGYFMVINASYEPSDFFVQTINSLCAGTTYEFSSWIINRDPPGIILPNITFTIERTDGTILSTYSTGDVPATNNPLWRRYAFYFTTPVGVSTVVIRMHNNAPGGGGNDLGLDDIAFTPAGPKTTIGINGVQGDTLRNLCNENISLFSTIGTCYVQNAYQWQTSANGKIWSDIVGATNNTYSPNLQVSGTYYYRLSVAGAGNIGNLNCRVNSNIVTMLYHQYSSPPLENVNAMICQGTSYVFPDGKTVKTAGVFKDTLLNKNGCDSLIIVLSLSIKPTAFSSLAATICQGQTYLGRSKSGVYIDTLTATNGCDSVRTLHLEVISLARSTINASVCFGNIYLGHNKSGTYVDTLATSRGCDSVRTLNLTVKPIAHSIVDATICQGGIYLGHGKSGVYTDTLTASNGCDSIRTLNLTVRPLAHSVINATICEGGVYLGYNKTGTYVDTLVVLNGCDSIRTLNLKVKPKGYSTINASICRGESYFGRNKSGTYVDTLAAANGCDSIRTINLVVNNKPVPDLGKNNIVCIGDSLTLNPGIFSQYLWQDGSTMPTYKVIAGGTYWVRVTDENGCTASDTITIKKVYCSLIKIPNTFTPNGDGINDTWDIYALQFYPDCKVLIYNRWGELVFRSAGYGKSWDGTNNGKKLPVGTYYYIIGLGNKTPKITGYVTIIR